MFEAELPSWGYLRSLRRDRVRVCGACWKPRDDAQVSRIADGSIF